MGKSYWGIRFPEILKFQFPRDLGLLYLFYLLFCLQLSGLPKNVSVSSLLSSVARTQRQTFSLMYFGLFHLTLYKGMALFVYLFFLFKLYLFIFGCVGSSLRHAGSSIVARGLLSRCGARAPECLGSVVAVLWLSCPVACGILVPRPGIEPASPALEGGFATAGPPGKSLFI